MKLEQEIFKQYVSEDKSRAEICESLGLSEDDLKAWIRFFGFQRHKSLAVVRRQWQGFIPNSLLRNSL